MLEKDAVFFSPHKFVGGVQTPGVLVAKKRLFRGERPPNGAGGGSVFFVGRDGHRYLQVSGTGKIWVVLFQRRGYCTARGICSWTWVGLTMILIVPPPGLAAMPMLPVSHLLQQSLADIGTTKTKSTPPSAQAEDPLPVDGNGRANNSLFTTLPSELFHST